jgi:hypothetical protein
MNKVLMVTLVLGLLTISACSCSNTSNTTRTTNGNNIQNANSVPQNNNIPSANSIQSNNIPSNDDTQKISDIKKTENIGKTFTVRGEVISSLQGTRFNISGYKIQDSNETIDISSTKIPALHTTVTVTGTLTQTRYFGLVIKEIN